MYLIDSDYLINYLKGEEKAVRLLNELSSRRLTTTIINVAEVLEDLMMSPYKKETAKFEEFLSNLTVFEINMDIARVFAKLRFHLRKGGKLVDNFDLLISSTAIYYELTLVTNNFSHFNKIPNLKIFSRSQKD